MRISKEPEVRKQEILDAAMELFNEKGYEATAMTDIAKRVGVVSGLCYRYFSSKHELYQAAVEAYVKECSSPFLAILNREEENFDAYLENMRGYFLMTEGKEKYHEFFHKSGNEMFNVQMSIRMCEYIKPFMEEFLLKQQQRGFIRVDDCRACAGFILYGEIAIVNDDSLSAPQKADKILEIIKKLVM